MTESAGELGRTDDHGWGIEDWDLVTGWLPAALTAAGFLALAALVLLPWRKRWWKRALIVAAATGLLVIAVNLFVTKVWRPFPDTLPPSVLVWAWLGLCGLTLAVAHVVTNPKRVLALLAGVVALVGIAGVQVNRYYGQYPTLGTALGISSPRLTDLSTVERSDQLLSAPENGFLSDVWRAQGVPEVGLVVKATIPPTVSGFHARPAYVYLPPAYLVTDPRPRLPVLVLLAGQPGNADSWLVSGRLAQRMDEYAKQHNGLAPIMVMPDNLGSNFANPLCVDSKRGNVETYLGTDVPAWVRANLQAAGDREMWAIAGLSNGGTCAVQLAVRKPDLYGRFIDISGEYEPLDGSKQETINRLFDGDAARYAAISPVEIMARKGFPDTAGRIVVGTGDSYREQLRRVLEVCQRAGMDMSWQELPGGHTWQVWAPGLYGSLPWLAQHTRLVR